MAKTAITPTREQDFAEWYQQVIMAADLAENSPVRGCMVIKPYGYAIWENIQHIFDARLKKAGVQNAYFPLLIPLEFLSKEAEHIDGFAKECAVVTHHRLKKNEKGELVPDGELPAPYVVRPTSEAIIGHVISKWVRSYRDLPLRLNQWCNVMRWEMRPRLFLRTAEFLWQEGHTVFETEKEAHEDAVRGQKAYYDLLVGDLAMPVILGEKTEEERFPGAKNTYTLEAMMQDGKALQSATSHYLGQSFSKAFNIQFLGRDTKEHTAYTASWGLSTRVIGGIIMTHGDDDGLVLPPAVAPYQVVIIPVIHDESKTSLLHEYCDNLKQRFEDLNLRVFVDISEEKSSNKVWKWIKRGAPIRIEIGLREIEASQMMLNCRDLPKNEKIPLKDTDLSPILDVLKAFEKRLRDKAIHYRDAQIQKIDTIAELKECFAKGFKGFAFMEKSKTDTADFESVAKEYALSRRCICQWQEVEGVLVAKSY